MISFSARSKRLYLLWDSYCISEFSPANVGFHVCTKRHRYQFRVLKSQGRIVSTYSWRLWLLFRAISWNGICISDLATVWINTLLWMAKAFLIGAAVFREMSWYTHSQQLEYLVNTSGYGVHTYIAFFFYFEDIVTLFALVGVSSQWQGWFIFILLLLLHFSDLCSSMPL